MVALGRYCPFSEDPLPRPNWSRPLPRPLTIPTVVDLVTLTDVGVLLGHSAEASQPELLRNA
jgi:hypothetical protein